jgi:hypothetical protein
VTQQQPRHAFVTGCHDVVPAYHLLVNLAQRYHHPFNHFFLTVRVQSGNVVSITFSHQSEKGERQQRGLGDNEGVVWENMLHYN